MVSITRNYGLVTSDLLALAEWIFIWRCTLVYTLFQSSPASVIIVSVMYGVLFDAVWFGVATVLMALRSRFLIHLESNFVNR